MSEPKRDHEPDDGSGPFSMRRAGKWMRWANVAWTFIGSFAMGALFGWLIDGWLGTAPVGVVAGAAIGFAGGSWIAVREVTRLGSDDDAD